MIAYHLKMNLQSEFLIVLRSKKSQEHIMKTKIPSIFDKQLFI